MEHITNKESLEFENKHVKNSLFFPLFVCAIIFIVHLIPFNGCHGITPRTFTNLEGLLTSPFLHADWQHLWSNIGPLYLLLAGFFYYFPERVFLIPAFGSIALNITVWIAARDGCHIGASGLIYLLATYLTTMAVFSKQKNLAAFVLIIVFLYGSMVWGILPGKQGVSWESHLFGALWGIILAIYYKHDKTWNEIHYPEPTLEDEDTTPDLEINEIENTLDQSSQNYKNSSAPHWMNAKEIQYSNEEKSDLKQNEKR